MIQAFHGKLRIMSKFIKPFGFGEKFKINCENKQQPVENAIQRNNSIKIFIKTDSYRNYTKNFKILQSLGPAKLETSH